MSDLHGNIINYSYNTLEDNQRINKITYNTSASVEFRYATRTVPLLSFRGGIKTEDGYYLSGIDIKFNAKNIATYSLSYQTHRNLPLLNTITLVNNGKLYIPVRIYYGEGIEDNGWETSTTQLLEWYVMNEPNTVKVMRGRFDYLNGSDGLISFPNYNPYWKHYGSSGKEQRFDNKYAGDEKILLYTGLSTEWEEPMPNLVTGVGFIDLLCADIVGLQEECIIKINNTVSDGMDQISFTTYQSNATTGISTRHIRTFRFPTVFTDKKKGKSIQPKYYYTGV